MTNRKDMIDHALLRSGRLEIHLFVSLPNNIGRNQIFRIHTCKMNTNNMMSPDVDIQELSDLTENYSGAEIAGVVEKAAALALYENLQKNNDDIIVNRNHFLQAINSSEPMFGNKMNNITKFIPNNFHFPTEQYKEDYDKILNIINMNDLNTILIYGKNRTGKTSLACKIAIDKNVIYTEMIEPKHIIKFNDDDKSKYLINLINDGYSSAESLIIFDDLEIILNFTNMNHSIIFSNKIYQTLKTILKTKPDKNNKTNIICICSDEQLYENLHQFFNLTIKIDSLFK